ncbi:hypothetical protein Ocin01_14853 [Orchesella cincta]|uniref:Uncharacterized protein n=1 Tax=Orchesella cincta TaxID=48709 RepID=A0A1D2MFR9_ORCCI|nr:hypothetical protein Ocin01_14853 [Orchesella cincta]
MTFIFAYNSLLLFLLTFLFIRIDSFSFNGSGEQGDCPRNGRFFCRRRAVAHPRESDSMLPRWHSRSLSFHEVLLPRAVNSTRGKCKLPTANPLKLNNTTSGSGAFDFQQTNCSSDSEVYSERLQRCVSTMGGGGFAEIWKWFFSGSITRRCSNQYYRSYARRCQNGRF